MGDIIMKKAIILKVTGIILIGVSPFTICISKYLRLIFPAISIIWEIFHGMRL